MIVRNIPTAWSWSWSCTSRNYLVIAGADVGGDLQPYMVFWLLAAGYAVVQLGFRAATYFQARARDKRNQLEKLAFKEERQAKELRDQQARAQREEAEAKRRKEAAQRAMKEKQEKAAEFEKALQDIKQKASEAAAAEVDAKYAEFRKHEQKRLEAEAEQREHQYQASVREAQEAEKTDAALETELAEARRAKEAADLRANEAVFHIKAADEKIQAAKLRLGSDWAQHVNIAICGYSGAGKSTFLNCIRGLPLSAGKDPSHTHYDGVEASPVGHTECTKFVKRYDDPRLPIIKWWDAPGMGTVGVPMRTYYDDRTLYVFDRIIIITNERVLEGAIQVADIASRVYNTEVAFVRARCNQDVDGHILSEKDRLERDPAFANLGEEALNDALKESGDKFMVKLARDHARDVQANLEAFSTKRQLSAEDRMAHKRIRAFCASSVDFVTKERPYQHDEFEQWLVQAIPPGLLQEAAKAVPSDARHNTDLVPFLQAYDVAEVPMNDSMNANGNQAPVAAHLATLPTKTLKNLLAQHNVNTVGMSEKSELVNALQKQLQLQ